MDPETDRSAEIFIQRYLVFWIGKNIPVACLIQWAQTRKKNLNFEGKEVRWKLTETSLSSTKIYC